MAQGKLARLVRLCDELLVELGALRGKAGNLPRWSRLSRPDDFGFLRRQMAVAELALAQGSPESYERLQKLSERPCSAAEGRWLIVEMIAAVAGCRLWALARRRKPGRAGRKQSIAARAGSHGKGPRAVRRRVVPVSPGRRLRGGREILEAMEGVYTYARWRAFKREALKHRAPIEWPKGQGLPRAYENQLRLWLADRMEAAERAREEREKLELQRLQLDPKTGKLARTGGDDQPLRVVRRPAGRRGR